MTTETNGHENALFTIDYDGAEVRRDGPAAVAMDAALEVLHRHTDDEDPAPVATLMLGLLQCADHGFRPSVVAKLQRTILREVERMELARMEETTEPEAEPEQSGVSADEFAAHLAEVRALRCEAEAVLALVKRRAAPRKPPLN